MTRQELENLWSETLTDESSRPEQFERLAGAALDVYASGDPFFRQHMTNRMRQVSERAGENFGNGFDLAAAKRIVADEIGFGDWDDLVSEIESRTPDGRPILFQYAIAAMERGDFSALESMVGGPDKFDGAVIDWYEKGFFVDEHETLAEVFSAACMLGHTRSAAYLLDKGVDPYAGMRTGLAGFHYAASSGRLDVIKLLIERGVPMEVKNMYGGTVFGQAMWSAVNEYTPNHAAIIEALVEAGAVVDDGYREWWDGQNVPDVATKERIAKVLRLHEEFHQRILYAKREVADAEAGGSNRILADALKQLGNILRRPPFTRDAANEAYKRAANLYRELGLPLEEAWVKRHIGINHEYAERLTEAERYYDEALELYRQNSKTDDGNFANAVRYPAVIKNRLGKRDESTNLWEEACRRYDEIDLPVGVAEAAAWLTIFAIEKGDTTLANGWFARAEAFAHAANDTDTDKFIAEVKSKLAAGEN